MAITPVRWEKSAVVIGTHGIQGVYGDHWGIASMAFSLEYLHIDHWSVAPMDGKRVQPWSLGHHTGGIRAWRGPQWLSGHHTHRMVAITVTIGAVGQWE